MSARDIYPRELLRLASDLACSGAGRGRPRTVNLCAAVITPSSNVRSVLAEPSRDLETLVSTFIDLQDARHSADYDHDFDVTKAAATGLVRRADEAVALAAAMRGGDPSYAFFCRLALGAVKTAKRH